MLQEKLNLANGFVEKASKELKERNIELAKITVTSNFFADATNDVEFALVGKDALDNDSKLFIEICLGSLFLPYAVKYYTELEYADSAIKEISTTIWQS